MRAPAVPRRMKTARAASRMRCSVSPSCECGGGGDFRRVFVCLAIQFNYSVKLEYDLDGFAAQVVQARFTGIRVWRRQYQRDMLDALTWRARTRNERRASPGCSASPA